MTRVRFAPSPTGFLHIGGARTALFNYVFSKKQSGDFILRIEDTDRERSTKDFEKDILESLRWLGLDWTEGPEVGGEHGPYHQSERFERHVAAAREIESKGKAYTDAEGVLRLKYDVDSVTVNDLICGDCVFKTDSLGTEAALLRSDGTPTFHIAVCSDDIEMGVTHVIRGQDHLTNSAKHRLIFEALGHEAPKFAHLPLILGEDGSKLSKRNYTGMTLVKEFKEAGYLPEAINNFLMLLGWSHPESLEQLPIDEAISSFDISRVGQTGAIFETNKLNFLNAWWIRNLDIDDLALRSMEFLGEYRALVEERGERFWKEIVGALRTDAQHLGDFERIAKLILTEEVEIGDDVKERFAPNEEKQDFDKVLGVWCELLNDLPLEPDRDAYSEAQFSQMMSQVKKRSEVKNKKTIFQSMRVAITGKLRGPELNVLVPLTSRDILLARAKLVMQLVK